jgi:hypothetical protein
MATMSAPARPPRPSRPLTAKERVVISSPYGRFTAAAKARAIEMAYNTIIHNGSYKSIAALDTHIQGQLGSTSTYAWPAFSDVNYHRVQDAIVTGVREILVARDFIREATSHTPRRSNASPTPYGERTSLYNSKAALVADLVQSRLHHRHDDSKVRKEHVKMMRNADHDNFDYSAIDNSTASSRSSNKKTVS